MIRAGEVSGQIDIILQRLADTSKRRTPARQRSSRR
jgi:type II secretory pathway component PulF